jgi:integrase
MSKMQTGSLQRKNGWYYLVSRDLMGKQKWTALHSRDEQEARARALDLAAATAAQVDEAAYLRAVVARGEQARARLAAMDGAVKADAVTWPGFFAAWRRAAEGLSGHARTLRNYEVQAETLARWACGRSVASPVALTAPLAQAFVSERAKACASAGRDVALFRRVWRDLRLGDVWGAVKVGGAVKPVTRYRRLTVDEVRRIVATARNGKRKVRDGGKWVPGGYDALPDVADMVALAYHTGLRRGDVAALTVGNVDASGEFLRVVPEKTEGRKGGPLLIPLQPEAAALVGRLVGRRKSETAPLFPRLCGAWLNKTLMLTWRRAGVKPNAFGRASFHSLRATFISMMDEAGVAAHVTDAITGHAPQGMHGRYSQPSGAALMEAVTRAIVPLTSPKS